VNGRPVVALIAGGLARGDGREEEEQQQERLWAAVAGLRAVLERGGRVLLSGESPQVVSLLMAAAEYQEPRAIETEREAVEAPVILGPLIRGDALEDELLIQGNRREEATGVSLLEELERSGLCEGAAASASSEAGAPELFGSLLVRQQVRGILAVGGGARTDPLLDAAESYRGDLDVRSPVRLLQLWPGSNRPDHRGWEAVTRYGENETVPPPMLNGEDLGEAAGRALWDEQLILLARRAAAEASLALAIDRAVGSMLGSEERGPQARDR
jgi:hypothetical protein